MMNRVLPIFILLAIGLTVVAQSTEEVESLYTNSADNILSNDSKLVIGGYGEVHYNQPLDRATYNNGNMDVHRIVMLFGYNFTEKTQFVTELEFEHVKEVYVEQAFIQHKLKNYLNFRGGLMLVPMGIVNEYHEPTTFNGVERPLIDKYIAPTTWREIGFGVTGNLLAASLKYQAYILNGFNGYDGSAKVSGKNGLRKGRQKGAESFMSSPNLSAKAEYYGIRGLNVGLSGYFGQTQSTLYDGVDKTDNNAIATADSSAIGVSMLGLDTRYSINGLQLRGQLYLANLSNTNQYNTYTGSDVGSSMIGYYAELGYNVLRSFDTKYQLIPFVRYEFFDTHKSIESSISKNLAYKKTAVTSGVSFALAKGAIVKADVQLVKDADTNEFAKTFNAGVGIMF